MIEGYSIPIHRSLTEPLLMAGAPRGIAIINGTIAAAVGLGMQMWLAGIVLGLIGHAAAVYAAKNDPKFLEVGVRHLKHGPYLSC
ncbi:VirB3 family type IV secretion system protein [Hyphococcus flavus]|uniref:VirB3 family type IV secretion system protein n=1 Tax=Hyphococcus flavus TaxID=1866326 RepID=A0AAF0CG72_9PROT|nr:VirB3 family type IV secretion system protein [Hyphococcus flavus]WDI31858.1 VirB3 family type IV secretion system protein [Hyphococcus flavus]